MSTISSLLYLSTPHYYPSKNWGTLILTTGKGLITARGQYITLDKRNTLLAQHVDPRQRLMFEKAEDGTYFVKGARVMVLDAENTTIVSDEFWWVGGGGLVNLRG